MSRRKYNLIRTIIIIEDILYRRELIENNFSSPSTEVTRIFL
jgi:hypothetical protein